MRATEEAFPVVFTDREAAVRELCWAGLKVSHVRARAGARAPLRDPAGACGCEHWGYVLSGRIEVRHADGGEEILEAGDAFYMAPGHTARFLADTHFVEFTPEEGVRPSPPSRPAGHGEP